MLGVDRTDISVTGVISLIVVAAVAVKWKDLRLYCFDPVQARAQGLSSALLHYGLLAGLSLSIVATLSAVGVILAIGLLITPGAVAFLLSRRLSLMLVIAVAVSEASMLAGISLSFWIDSAPAPTIMLIQTATFIAAFITRQTRMKMASMQHPVAMSQHSQ